MKINILNNQHASEKDVKICLEKEKVNLKLTFEKNNVKPLNFYFKTFFVNFLRRSSKDWKDLHQTLNKR